MAMRMCASQQVRQTIRMGVIVAWCFAVVWMLSCIAIALGALDTGATTSMWFVAIRQGLHIELWWALIILTLLLAAASVAAYFLSPSASMAMVVSSSVLVVLLILMKMAVDSILLPAV